MAFNTDINWADSSVNFWEGCKKVSQGCKYCYAERLFKQFGKEFRLVRRTSDKTFYAALKWKEPRKIFTCSISDFFIEEADEWRSDAWNVIRATPQHTWLILTKRPERVLDHLPEDWGEGWTNVYLGVSVENQEQADKRIPLLKQIPASRRFLSCEPLLEHTNIARYLAHSIRCERAHPGGSACKCPLIHWVIAGGESGPNYRRVEADWIRALRDACITHNVAFHFKQWDGSTQAVIKAKGNYLDGKQWLEFPEREDSLLLI